MAGRLNRDANAAPLHASIAPPIAPAIAMKRREPKTFLVERAKIERQPRARAIVKAKANAIVHVKPLPQRRRAAWAKEVTALEFSSCGR